MPPLHNSESLEDNESQIESPLEQPEQILQEELPEAALPPETHTEPRNISVKLVVVLIVALVLIIASLSKILHSPTATSDGTKPAAKKVAPIDPDTLNWQQVVFSTTTPHWRKRDSHAVFTFNNRLWVLGGIEADESKVNGVPDYETATYYNDIWSSADGKTWKLESEHGAFPPIRSQSVIFFKGALYMYGGWSPKYGLAYKNGIWKSTDGVNWEQVVKKPDYPEREGQIVTEWNGRLWLVGGVNYFGRKTFNDVWYSDDGIHWTASTKDAPWHSRWDHAVGIWDNKIWVAGGMNFNGVGYGDLWSSPDGAVWKEELPLAPWGKRQGQEIVNYHGYMWLVTGLDAKTNEGKGDAWYTKDGVEWKRAPQQEQWLGREDQGVIVFDDKIWVLGGMRSDWSWSDEIWYSTFRPMPEASTTPAKKK